MHEIFERECKRMDANGREWTRMEFDSTSQISTSNLLTLPQNAMNSVIPHYDCRFGKASRRGFIGGAASGFFGFAVSHLGRAPVFGSETSPAKRLLVIWADGGPSQFETFDPKPGETTGGGTGAIETAARGIAISEKLPLLAKRMDRLSVVRNLTSPEGDHVRASYYLHTGYPLIEAFPRPSLGAVMSHRIPAGDLPNYVSIGAGQGFGPAFLGLENGPFAIENPKRARDLLRNLESRRKRIELTRHLSEHFSQSHRAASEPEARLAVLAKIERLIATDFSKALDIDSDKERARFGGDAFGERLLLGRRLLEIGVPFVEVTLGGWDTHANNAANTTRLCGQLDRPFAALIDDLAGRGLWEETVVVWLGEFGRTPQINAAAGRDHFPTVVPVVIGGGGFAEGQVIGSTNRDGTGIEGQAYTVPDLFATLFGRIGVDPGHEYETSFGSMTTATDSGKVIAELG